MIRTILAATAVTLTSAIGFATAATASPGKIPVQATYNPTTQRFCVRPTTLEDAAAINTGIYQRQCRTARQWRSRGVVFDAPVRGPRLARM